MSNDPVIEEVRRARIELSRELGNDPKRFLEYFAALREEHRRTGQYNYVTPPTRKSALKESAPPYHVSNDKYKSDH